MTGEPNGQQMERLIDVLSRIHLEMHQGANRFASIAPDDVSLPTKDDLVSNFTDYLKKGASDPDGTMALDKVIASSKAGGAGEEEEEE